MPVNNFRWFRGFDDYDQWQTSGVSHQGALSFYYPEEPKKCVDCHMPLVPSKDAANIDGKVHSHRFPAANTALPFVNKHDEQLKATVDFLQNNQVSVDIFALSPATPIQPQSHGSSASGFSTSSTRPQLRAFSMMDDGNQGHAIGTVTDITKLVAPINDSNGTVQRGEEVRVDVVVRTRNVGQPIPRPAPLMPSISGWN